MTDQIKFNKSMNYIWLHTSLRLSWRYSSHAISAIFVPGFANFISEMHFFHTHTYWRHLSQSWHWHWTINERFECCQNFVKILSELIQSWHWCFFAANMKVVHNWILWLTVLRLIQHGIFDMSKIWTFQSLFCQNGFGNFYINIYEMVKRFKKSI